MTADTFFQELKRLLQSQPKLPPVAKNSENCEYADKVYYSKNLMYCFDSAYLNDCMFVYDSSMSPHCVDCDYTDESELCYDSVDAFKCYNGNFLEYCSHLRDSWYSANCFNGHDLFGCVDLQNKSFCIFNRQLTEPEYRQKIEIYKKWPKEKVLAEVEKLKKRYPLTQTHEGHNENTVYGNYMHYNKNCYLLFDGAHNEDSMYLYDSFRNKTLVDATYTSPENQSSYEVVDSSYLYNCSYAVYSDRCRDSRYIFHCTNVNNSLGCVGLTNKEYCILNRQFSKEEYERISQELKQTLREANAGWDQLEF